MSETTVKDKVVLIIGAGREPGPTLAAAFADQGAIVAVNDLSPVVLDPLVTAAQLRGQRLRAYAADATRGMPLRAMLDEVLDDWGRIDILINNPRVQPNTPILTMDEWDWQRTIEMNLNGPFVVTQLVARMMIEQGRGVILNVVDDIDEASPPASAAYMASQAGLRAFTRTAAHELIAYNIRVYGICPDRALFTTQEPLQPTSYFSASTEGQISQLAVFLCGETDLPLPGQILKPGMSEAWARKHSTPPGSQQEE